MSAVKWDIVIEQGAKFELPILYIDDDGLPMDLTSYTVAMHIRKFLDDVDTIEELDESNGITLGGLGGTIDIEIGADTTKDYNFNIAVYDLVLYPDGESDDAVRLLEGNVKLKKQVTR